MSYARKFLAALAVTAVLASPLAAQDHAVSIYARSGGFNALTNLNDAGTADFNKVGYNIGGGVGVQVHRYVTLRADFDFARNELQTNGVATGTKLNRFFYDAAVQLQYPTAIGLEPYLFAGGGAVTFHEVGTTGQNKTKGTGTFGLGVNYAVPNTGLGFFVEGQGWLYDAKNLTGSLAGYDKMQVEMGWSGGLAYRIPL